MFNYPSFNLSPQQQRLMQLEQQQMQQNFNAQQQQMQQAQPKGFQIIPVTNQQEAYAAQIDIMNGTPSFFYNQNAGEIYLKQINQYGKADFIKFAKQNEPLSNENEQVNINSHTEILNALSEKIDGLYKLLKNNETVSEQTNSKGSKNAK